MSVGVFGQTIPYTALKTIDECAKELRQIEGFSAELVIKHSDPKDSRDFQVLLETSEGRKELKINKDGTFRLPAVKADEQRNAQVIHSLEKGALTLSMSFEWDLKSTRNTHSNLFDLCSEMVTPVRSAEPVFIKIGDMIPDLRDLPIVIVGVSLTRDVPCSGLAILKNGEKTIASLDLSQTGKASWMFADYDPRTHRIEFEMKNGAAEPYIHTEMRVGKEGAESKGAILVRKPR
jgi:hypothetical protein